GGGGGGVGVGGKDDVGALQPLVGAHRAKDVRVVVNHRDSHGPSSKFDGISTDDCIASSWYDPLGRTMTCDSACSAVRRRGAVVRNSTAARDFVISSTTTSRRRRWAFTARSSWSTTSLATVKCRPRSISCPPS